MRWWDEISAAHCMRGRFPDGARYSRYKTVLVIEHFSSKESAKVSFQDPSRKYHSLQGHFNETYFSPCVPRSLQWPFKNPPKGLGGYIFSPQPFPSTALQEQEPTGPPTKLSNHPTPNDSRQGGKNKSFHHDEASIPFKSALLPCPGSAGIFVLLHYHAGSIDRLAALTSIKQLFEACSGSNFGSSKSVARSQE